MTRTGYLRWRAALIESCPRFAGLFGEARRCVRELGDSSASAAPLAVVMARRLPRIPWLLRPLVGLWWGAHFFGAAALGILVNDALHVILKHAPLQQRLFLPLAFYLPLVFSANLYLLLAAAVFFRNPTVHARLWSWRLAIDMALIFVAWGLGMRG